MTRPDFMSQFKHTKDAEASTNDVICHLAAMPPDMFLKYMEELWTDLGVATTKAVARGLIREPHAREIDVLLRFAYRCIALSTLFETLRDQGLEVEPSQHVLDEARRTIEAKLRDLD